MKYCANCGAQLQDDSAFCGKCGHKVGSQVTNEVSRKSSNNLPSTRKRMFKMDKKYIKYGIGIITLLIIGIFIIVSIQNNNSKYDNDSSYSTYDDDNVNNNNESSMYINDEEEYETQNSEMTCPLCRGERMVTMQHQTTECPACYGNATISQERYNELTEIKSCPTTDPFGYPCQICGGSGQATALALAQYLKDPDPGPGPNPGHGEGCCQCRIPGNGNVKGNGQCKACNGAGTFNGYDLDRIVCNQCAGKKPNGEGDGRCRYCNGTGWR